VSIKQPGFWKPTISESFERDAEIVMLAGDAAETLKAILSGTIKLAITSPPYNLGKAYEKATALGKYMDEMTPILRELVRVLSPQPPSRALRWRTNDDRNTRRRQRDLGAFRVGIESDNEWR
jgi:DNA modification methylase